MPDERMMKSFTEATTHFQAQKAAKEWFEGRNTPAANQARIKIYNYVNYLLFSGVEPSAEFAKLVTDIEAEVGLLKEKELAKVNPAKLLLLSRVYDGGVLRLIEKIPREPDQKKRSEYRRKGRESKAKSELYHKVANESKEAVDKMMASAAQDIGVEQYELSGKHWQDAEKSFAHAKRSVELGDPRGFYRLARYYQQHIRPPTVDSQNEALHYYELAIEHNNNIEMLDNIKYALKQMNSNEQIRGVDPSTLYHKVCNKLDELSPGAAKKEKDPPVSKSPAQKDYDLGRCYERGVGGLRRDMDYAIRYYELAARQGLDTAIRWQLAHFEDEGYSGRTFLNKCRFSLVSKTDLVLKGEEGQFLTYLVKNKAVLLKQANGNLDQALILALNSPDDNFVKVAGKIQSALTKLARTAEGEIEGEKYFTKLEMGVSQLHADEAKKKLEIAKRLAEKDIKGNGSEVFYKQAAQLGNAEAQSILGRYYYEGIGVKQDYHQAFYWCRKAAHLGLPEAQCNLAYQYAYGKGVSSDEELALKYYELAARQGFNTAIIEQHEYLDSFKVFRKHDRTFLAACKRGLVDDSFRPKLIPEENIFFKYLTDNKEALLKRAENNYDRAIVLALTEPDEKFSGIATRIESSLTKLAKLVDGETEGARYFEKLKTESERLRREEKTRLHIEVIDFFKKAEELKKIDAKKAAEYYLRAANMGDNRAQNRLGIMYKEGEGVAKDAAQAVAWYRKAIEQNNAISQFHLANMYARGEGVAKDAAQAVAWYKKSAEQGYASAQCNLANMYAQGEGVAKDAAQAVVWYKKAAEQGHKRAQYNLGCMYQGEWGLNKDQKTSLKYFELAARQGLPEAIKQQQEYFEREKKSDHTFLMACKRVFVDDSFQPKLTEENEKKFCDHLRKNKEPLLELAQGNIDQAIIVALSLSEKMAAKIESGLTKMAELVDGKEEGAKYVAKLKKKAEELRKQEAQSKAPSAPLLNIERSAPEGTPSVSPAQVSSAPISAAPVPPPTPSAPPEIEGVLSLPSAPISAAPVPTPTPTPQIPSAPPMNQIEGDSSAMGGEDVFSVLDEEGKPRVPPVKSVLIAKPRMFAAPTVSKQELKQVEDALEEDEFEPGSRVKQTPAVKAGMFAASAPIPDIQQQSESSKAESSKAESSKAESSKAESSKAESSKAESSDARIEKSEAKQKKRKPPKQTKVIFS